MINDKITIVTSPDFDHNSDYKICLVGDSPLINDILPILDKDERRVSVHCVTENDKDFTWIANTVNSSNFVFVDKQTKIDRLYLGWVLSRPNVYHNSEEHRTINNNYSFDVFTSLVKQLDSNNGG